MGSPSLYSSQHSWEGRWFRPRKGTLGAMDLGGASTQITFETASPVEDPTNEVQLRLYGQHYHVYTHSFLCYGRDQVLRRLLASALQVPDHPPSPPIPLCPPGWGERGGMGPRVQSGAWTAAVLKRASPGSRQDGWEKAQGWRVGLGTARLGRKWRSGSPECLAQWALGSHECSRAQQ